MENKYVVMVINGVFSEASMLIIKSQGKEIILRYDKYIDVKELDIQLENHLINKDDCKIVVTDKNWNSDLTISSY